ncbi:MAG: hypothetical protein SGCHY_003973 [Lobulomycetales sp.]
MRGIVHILVASLLVYCVSAQALCAKNRGKTIGCLHSKDAGEDIEFQIDTNVKVGYIGFGLGSDMSRAEIYVAWEYEGEVVLSRRSSSGRVEPKATEQIHTVIKSSVSPDGLLSVTFLRPKNVRNGVSLAGNSKSPIIWAYTPAAVEEDGVDAQISFHGDRKGASRGSVSLLAATSAVGGGGSGQEAAPQNKAFLTAHIFLMTFAWAVSAPMGVAIARFFKTALGSWWFRLHIGFMLIGTTVVSIVGLACIAAYIGTPWIDFAKYSPTGRAHILFGVLTVLLAAIQVVSGFIIDKLFDADRKSIPWYDKMHWWMGRIAGSLGYVNVGVGIALYGAYGNDTAGLAIAYGVWTVLLLGLFIFASIKIGQTHDGPPNPKLKGYAKMQDVPLESL